MSYHHPQQQVVYRQVNKPPNNGLTIAALILGIVGLAIGIWSVVPLLGVAAAFTSFLPAVLAVIFGHVGLKTYRTVGAGKGQAITGLILGYVTLGIIAFTTLFWIITISTSDTSIIA